MAAKRSFRAGVLPTTRYLTRHAVQVAERFYPRSEMGIQNDGELFSDADMDAMRRENDELKKDLGEAYLDIKILKIKVRDGCPKTSREEIQNYARGFEVSQNRIHRLFGVSRGTSY
jgi:hypothetical protein